MKVSDYNYNLPEKLIAIHPPKIRGNSKLLVLDKDSGEITHKKYADFAEFIKPGDVVVLNDTMVIKARLKSQNSDNKSRELLLLEDHNNTDLKIRKVLYKGKIHKNEILEVNGVGLEIIEILGNGIAVVRSPVNLIDLSEKSGSMPLPPYMHRDATEQDNARYQTVFARDPGSVAAPTASLNFTLDLQNKIIKNGGVIAYLTLHVGLGTFLPIRSDNIQNHKMHSEYFEIPMSTIEAIKKARYNKNKVYAIGTTVTRTLEYANSHFPSLLRVRPLTDGENVNTENISVISGEADIFIYPGYEFGVVDGLLTNFHAPKSTVLMLAAAFAGWGNLEHAYKVAIEEQYALLSYGDSMLIL